MTRSIHPAGGEVISAARRIEGASALPAAARPLWLAASEEFAAWRAGDQRALERLVRLLTPVLWQLARSSARCRHLLRVIACEDRPDYASLTVQLGMPVGGIGPTRRRCLDKLRALLRADPEWGRP